MLQICKNTFYMILLQNMGFPTLFTGSLFYLLLGYILTFYVCITCSYTNADLTCYDSDDTCQEEISVLLSSGVMNPIIRCESGACNQLVTSLFTPKGQITNPNYFMDVPDFSNFPLWCIKYFLYVSLLQKKL